MSKLLGALALVAIIAGLGWSVVSSAEHIRKLESSIEDMDRAQEAALSNHKAAAYASGVEDTIAAAKQHIIDSCTGRTHELVVSGQTFICQPKQEI